MRFLNEEYDILDHSHDTAKEIVVINWLIGNKCNYSCSYCPSWLHKGDVEWPNLNNVQQFIVKTVAHYAPKKVYFEFTGGEVTLWKNLIPLAKFIRNNNATIGIISNGSRPPRWWSEHKKYFDHVCFSFHAEFGNPDKFLSVIKEVTGEFRTHVNIMMNPDTWDECIQLAERIPNECLNVSLALQPLMEGLGEEETVFPYTEEQQQVLDRQHHLYGQHIKWNTNFLIPRGAMKMIDLENDKSEISSAHRLIANKMNNWSGWRCYAGLENLVVDHDGSLWRGWCREGGELGNMYGSYELPTIPVLCTKKFCHCNFDIMCKKEKNA
jgi:MoaA/NifB/PqqE/SkfB family radical SAM enzyme